MDVGYCHRLEELVEFRKKSEMGKRRQKEFCLCCERSVGCFPGSPCFDAVCTCLARILLLPLENVVRLTAGCCRVKKSQTINSVNFRTSLFFLWKRFLFFIFQGKINRVTIVIGFVELALFRAGKKTSCVWMERWCVLFEMK